MKAMQFFTDKKVGNMRCYLDKDNTIHFNIEDSVNGLGFVTYGKNGETRIMWDSVKRLLKSFDYNKKVKADDYIPENIFYLLAMRADNPSAINFQKWIGNEVIPSIRRTGTYSVQKQLAEPSAERKSQIQARKEATGVYEMYSAYARKQGDTRKPKRIYAKFSNLANRISGIPNGCRALATAGQLKICEMAEKIISQTLLLGISANKHYKEIEESVLLKGTEILQLAASSQKLLESGK